MSKEQSDIQLSSEILKISNRSQKKPAKKDKGLQRTEEWFNQRKGSWTASQMKNLMSCSGQGGKLTWNDVDKLFYFGKTALKYIYENAMERKTDRYIDSGLDTKATRYGTKVEPLIFKISQKKLSKIHKKAKLIEVGFKKFDGFETAGVSSDGLLVKSLKKKEPIASMEYKACTNWNTHYDRTFELVDDKNQDFWQMQSQMIAWKVNTCYYCVSEPPNDINEYLQIPDDEIFDAYKKFKKECKVTVQEVKASKLHQLALLRRIFMAEKTLEKFLSKGGNLKEILEETVEYYHDNQEELIKIQI
tara:strand:+ start:9037 stop:9945 length:909 start_codon:yes stop_codon:yes gene_type:complete